MAHQLIQIGRFLVNEKTQVLSRNHLDMRATRQTLQFLTLIWIAGAPICFNIESVQRFVSALVHYLCSCSSTEGGLHDATLSFLAVLERHRDELASQSPDLCYRRELLWALTISADPSDLLVACEWLLPPIVSLAISDIQDSLASDVCIGDRPFVSLRSHALC